MVEALIEETRSHLMELNVLQIDGDLADAVRIGKLTREGERELRNLGKVFASNDRLCKLLVSNIKEIGKNNDSEEFWDALVDAGVSPGLLQAFCYSLMKNSSGKVRGALVYCSLLTINPFSMIWNSMVFSEVLSLMAVAAETLDQKLELDEYTGRVIIMTGDVFEILSLGISEAFKATAGIDVVIALIELSVKLCTIYQKHFDSQYDYCAPKAMGFLDRAAELWLEYCLPSVSLALIIDFLPPTKGVTCRVVRIRDEFLGFCERHLKGKDNLLLLMMKHVMTRTSDRQATRENAAIVIQKLVMLMNDSDAMFRVLLKFSRAQKQSLRVLSLEIFRTFIDSQEIQISEELQLEIVERVHLSIMDQMPNVRATAMSVASSIIQSWEQMSTALGLTADENEFDFTAALHLRLADEKLNVRKASLKCLRALVNVSNEPPTTEILQMIAERTRDRAVVMRQEAAKLLSTVLRMYGTDEINRIWLDHILPLALDQDTKTQQVALSSIDELFVNARPVSELIKRIEYFEIRHIEVLRKVFRVFIQKAIPLTKLVRNLEKHLSVDSSPMIWKVQKTLLSELPKLARYNYLQLWEQRDKLPVDYLEIVALLSLHNEQVIEDSVVFLRNISEGKGVYRDFAVIHCMVEIMVRTYNDYEREATDLITFVNDKINSAASNEKLTEHKLRDMIAQIFLMGELFEHSKALKNLDFTGLQLMIAEKLPNEVKIPEDVRAIATISLGKLCLFRRDFSSSFVAAFVSQLHHEGNSAVKCNCLVALCDLCVKYSATVDPYVIDMSACFADSDPTVRHQALLIMTKLLAEDYLKIRPLVFFRFAFCVVDEDQSVADFARSCLFDVINLKDPRLLADHFVRALLYFNECIKPEELGESNEQHEQFKLTDPFRRRNLYSLMIGQMSGPALFRLMDTLCMSVLGAFVEEKRTLDDGESLLSDTFDIMIRIEEELDALNSAEYAASDDPRTDKIVSESRTIVNDVHVQLVQKIFPIMNQLHQYLRLHHSPLQGNLKGVYKRITQKHPSLLDDLAQQEPVLSMEIKAELSTVEETDVVSEPPSSPRWPTAFRSPALSRILRNRPQVLGSATSSPLIHMLARSRLSEDELSSQKRPPFRLEE